MESTSFYPTKKLPQPTLVGVFLCLHVWVGVWYPVCTLCRNSSGISASLIGMWLQLGLSDLVHSGAWVRSVRPSNIQLDIVLSPNSFLCAKCQIWRSVNLQNGISQFGLFPPEGLFTCDLVERIYIRVRFQGTDVFQGLLSHQETSDWSFQEWT